MARKTNQTKSEDKRERDNFGGVDIKDIDYKNIPLLKKFLGPRKKILPQSVTKLKAKQQRKLKAEIKKARIMGLLAFTDRHSLS